VSHVKEIPLNQSTLCHFTCWVPCLESICMGA